jgi:hypothetical protein
MAPCSLRLQRSCFGHGAAHSLWERSRGRLCMCIAICFVGYADDRTGFRPDISCAPSDHAMGLAAGGDRIPHDSAAGSQRTPARCGIFENAGSAPAFAGTAVFGVLAMWTRGWDGAAMENWSRGGAPLTLAQLVNCAGFWEAISGRLLTLFVLTSPALYLLAVEGARRNGRNTLRSS